jgi:hypothetical protein
LSDQNKTSHYLYFVRAFLIIYILQ